jgi:hypothetical protein
MLRLSRALNAWGSADFEAVLKRELEQLDADQLPLQRGLSLSSHVAATPFRVMVVRVSEEADALRARIGVFYAGIIGGCSCADDPTPVDEHSEYCEVQLAIDKQTADVTVTLLDSVPDSE